MALCFMVSCAGQVPSAGVNHRVHTEEVYGVAGVIRLLAGKFLRRVILLMPFKFWRSLLEIFVKLAFSESKVLSCLEQERIFLL